jgi:peptidoglycan hydrolase-like protein with peptidoglycan-binding domain
MNVEPWQSVGPGDGPQSVVAGLQWLLRAHGHSVAADGTYGVATSDAVAAFRGAAGLPPGGTVDDITWMALVIATRSGDSGDAVRGVQQFQPGRFPDAPELAVDGIYGPDTVAAVREFQRQWGLTIDGIAGRETWSFLQARRGPGAPWPLAKVGQEQDDNWRIRAVQNLLVHAGRSLVVDGIYGPLTGEATRQWQQTQRAQFISTTCGQLDWPALTPTVGPGDSGSHVAAVQSLLPTLVEDGVYGPLTEQAVRDFQDMFAPPTDGIVGPITWYALVVPKGE